MNGPNKLGCLLRLAFGIPGAISQDFIFFLTYDCAQQATVFHCDWLGRLVRDQHSNLLGPFVVNTAQAFG
jgi:hypothetical protein